MGKTRVLSLSESEAAGQTVGFVERGRHRDGPKQLRSRGLQVTAANPAGHQKLLSLSRARARGDSLGRPVSQPLSRARARGGLTRETGVSLAVKSLPASAGEARTQAGSLGQEDPLEKDMATHSRILAWRIPRTEEPGGLQSLGSQS